MKRLLTFLTIISLTALAYSQSVADVTREYISNSLKGKTSSETILKLDKYSLDKILESCSTALNDSSVDVRRVANELIYIVSLRKNNDPQISKAVNVLINGCKDSDGGIVYSCLRYLRYFKPVDFDTEARIKLGQMARENGPHYDMLVRLTGFVGIKDLMYDYSEMLSQKNFTNKKIVWALHLTLARLGNTEEQTYCINKIRQIPVSDDVVYDLLPDLAYTQNKEAFDYMLDVINSDEKNCYSSNPDSDAKIICAYRVIAIVAPYINNFPVKTDKAGDIIASDYPQMLTDVRQWIATNKQTYTLNNLIY
jgi:hypothetical protein